MHPVIKDMGLFSHQDPTILQIWVSYLKRNLEVPCHQSTQTQQIRRNQSVSKMDGLYRQMIFVMHLPILCGVSINKSTEIKNLNMCFLFNSTCIIILRTVFFSGKIARYILGNIIAFLSGLFFTANNFVIKGASLSFGEVLAVRSIIQVPLMAFLLLFRGII